MIHYVIIIVNPFKTFKSLPTSNVFHFRRPKFYKKMSSAQCRIHFYFRRNSFLLTDKPQQSQQYPFPLSKNTV